jgi:hypothetical protein
MACISCQERREAIARIAAQIGTVVFGRKRVLAAPEKPAPQKPDQEEKNGQSGT